MRICWKALIGYGVVFWLALCLSDFLGTAKYKQDTDETFYEKPAIVQASASSFAKARHRTVKFGWSLLLWNSLTFSASLAVCWFGKSVVGTLSSVCHVLRNKFARASLTSPPPYSRASLSKIPVIMKSRRSDTAFSAVDTRIDKSCPNLLMKRTGSNLSSATDVTSKTCRTLYRRDLFLCETPGLSPEQQLETQCQRLREELHRLQATSLKEHAILSRKLDSVNKDKKDIAKQLSVAQKENRAAKQQLEELVQEKASLLKKLENATKEFKFNTKTKKFALAKLEEVTNNVDELRQQLEQVSRDKEILEKKMKILEMEYAKLQERYFESQKLAFPDEVLPERDIENTDMKYRCDNSIPPALQQAAEVLASVSQSELDMKKIQEKIKQLEKNLENLNMENSLNFTKSLDGLESELSLSPVDDTSCSKHDNCSGEVTYSELSSGNTPRYKNWSDRVVELIGKNKHQFAKIQALASKMQEKARQLGHVRDKFGGTEELDEEDDDDEDDSSRSDEAEPKRLVSSSVAFKNFLKSLNTLDAAKHNLPSKRGIYF